MSLSEPSMCDTLHIGWTLLTCQFPIAFTEKSEGLLAADQLEFR